MSEMDRRSLFGLAALAVAATACGRADGARQGTPPVDEVTGIVGPIGPVESFPTVDELDAFADGLAAKHPGRVTITELGRSRAGEPIREVRVGSGERHIIVLGNPHPNEPIGMATIRHLLGRFAEDEALTLGATWHFVLCVDPDGTRLNEGWFAGPLTRSAVAREFYRPVVTEQPEWAFPITWRDTAVGTPLPETQALMTLIDRTRPAFIASLHNADFGGGFFYTSGGDDTYWTALTDLLTTAQVPVYEGEPDAPGSRPLATGVFELVPFDTMAQALITAGADPVATLGGGGSLDYSARYGTAVLVCELPLWTDARITDATPTARSVGSVFRESAAGYRDIARTVGEVLDRVGDRFSGTSALERSVRAMVADLPGLVATRESSTNDRPASMGEVFTEQYVWLGSFRLRLGGMLTRLLAAEAARDPSPVLAAERDRFGAVFTQWCTDIEQYAPGQRVPLDRLVAIQAGAIVTAATRLRDGRPV